MKMSNKVKDIDVKNYTYSFFNDIFSIENPTNIKIYQKSYKKNSYLLYWTCDEKRSAIRKNPYCKSFVRSF